MFLFDYLRENDHKVSLAAPVTLTAISQPITALVVTGMDAGDYDVSMSVLFAMDDKDDKVHLEYSGATLGVVEFVEFGTDKGAGGKSPSTYKFPYTHTGGDFDLTLNAYQELIGSSVDVDIETAHLIATRVG